jgi:hypothetical protein
MDFLDESLTGMIIESDIKNVYKGVYDDYGRLENVKHPEIHDSGDYRGFFISEQAWTFGKTLINSPDYKTQMKYISDRFEMKKQIKNLEELVKKNAELNEFNSIINFGKSVAGKSEIEEEDVKILMCLRTFCYLNNFNLLDPSFQNWYGGQTYNIEEKEQFNKLRQKRIDFLKNEEKKWEEND